MNRNLKGGLFDGRGKPQPLALKASKQTIITPEKHIQSAFIRWRDMFKRAYPILNAIFSVPNGIWTHRAIAAAQVAQGLTSGIPDVICLAPSADGKHHALLIEFKTEDLKKSNLTEEQEFYRKFFSGLGYRFEVCRDWSRAAGIVCEHLNLKIPVYGRNGRIQ